MLASVQKIIKIEPIENADNIELAFILGWQVVIKKGEFKVGDLVSYIEIDTIVPELPQYEFLRERKFRVRTIKLRKQLSQGLIVPLPDGKWKEGDDLTDILEIKKYTKEIESPAYKLEIPKTWYKKLIYLFKYKILYVIFPKLKKQSKLNFPTNIISKTDEVRVQNIPYIFKNNQGIEISATEKINGTSITIIYDASNKNHYRICSRNYEYITEKNQYTSVFEEIGFSKYIDALVNKFGNDVMVQGEMIGNNIQGNYYNLEDKQILLFNIFVNREKLCPKDMLNVCEELNIPHCPEIYRGNLNFTMEEIVNFADGISVINPKIAREGVVVRSYNDNKLSFKSVSNKYLLKNKE